MEKQDVLLHPRGLLQIEKALLQGRWALLLYSLDLRAISPPPQAVATLQRRWRSPLKVGHFLLQKGRFQQLFQCLRRLVPLLLSRQSLKVTNL